MNARYPKNRSSPIVHQVVPRNAARTDVPSLALNDGGHGTALFNAVLYGLGGTLQFQFNASMRTFVVQMAGLNAANTEVVTADITSLLQTTDVTRRYQLPGSVGTYPLGVAGLVAADYASVRVITFTIISTNVTISTTNKYSLTISNSGTLRHCAVAEECDFPAMKALNKAGIRIYDNVVTHDDAANAPVSFVFSQLDLLAAKAPDFIALMPGYDAGATVGIEFRNDAQATGGCGPQADPGTPGCGSIDCCCAIDGNNVTYPGVSAQPGDAVAVGATITVIAEIPLIGGTGCIGFQALSITLPGSDSNGGYFGFKDDTNAVLVQGTTQGTIAFTIDPPTGLGHNLSRTITLSAPITCGQSIQIRFQVVSLRATVGDVSIGSLIFSDTGVCDPASAGVGVLGFSVTDGGSTPPGPPNEVLAFNTTGITPTPINHVPILGVSAT